MKDITNAAQYAERQLGRIEGAREVIRQARIRHGWNFDRTEYEIAAELKERSNG